MDVTHMQAHVTRKTKQIEWLRTQGGAILRCVQHMLREPPQRIKPMDGCEDCLHKLVKGHQAATAAWLWQATTITTDAFTETIKAHSMAYQTQVQDYLTQWNQEIVQAPTVKEYLSQQTGGLIHSLGSQLRESRNRLRQLRKRNAGRQRRMKLRTC